MGEMPCGGSTGMHAKLIMLDLLMDNSLSYYSPLFLYWGNCKGLWDQWV